MDKAPIIHCPYKPDKSDDEIYCDIGEFKMDLFNRGAKRQRDADHKYYLKQFKNWSEQKRMGHKVIDKTEGLNKILQQVWESGKSYSQVFDFQECLNREKWDINVYQLFESKPSS